MPLFTPYFSLDSSAYRVGNGGRLRCHMGAAGIGIYVMLLSHLRDCRDYRAPLDYDLLAFDLHEDADAVRRVVEEFDLFDIDRASGTFTSSALDAVRALGTSDSPSSGRASTRTGRVRRVRTAAQAYRRSVRRLAADNALPPDAEEDIDEPADAPLTETEFAPADARTPHGETDTTQATTSADAPDTRTPRGEIDTTQAKTSATHPNTDTPHGESSTTQAKTSADAPDTEAPAASTADDARGADAEDGVAFVPPTANEVRRFAQALHLPEFDAEWFVHYYTARHWQRHNGHPVRSWQTTARYWLTHPLQVAQHLLRHRPAPGAAPAGTGAPLGGISPSSAGTSPSSAGVVATTGSASPSSAGLGAVPAGTRPSSPASGVPLGGSLSLPAPTALQQSRLCDLRHMVLQLFADTPDAAPDAASTVPDAPAAVSTPVPSVPTSTPTPRVLSPAEAAHFIEAQTLATDPAEEENRACEISTADNEEGIDTQAFSTTDNEEDARTCESDAADIGGDMDTQAISTTKERFGTRSSHGPAPPTGDEAAATAARHRPPPHATEKHPFTLNLNHDAHPLLPLHPPAPVGLGSTLRVQSAQPPFGRALLGRIDSGRAPRPAGSRPLRSQPTEDRRATLDHVSLGGVHEPKTANFIDNSVVDEHPSRSDAGEHHADEHPHRDFAAKRHLDAPFDGIHEPKTADFIDKSVVDEPQRRPDAGEHSADEHNAPADEHPSRSDTGKHHSDKPEHRSDEPPSRPDAGKHHSDEHPHPADRHNAPADEFDAGQRLLDTAAHRRVVRAELAECCGALRHLAHCCVAF